MTPLDLLALTCIAPTHDVVYRYVHSGGRPIRRRRDGVLVVAAYGLDETETETWDRWDAADRALDGFTQYENEFIYAQGGYRAR